MALPSNVTNLSFNHNTTSTTDDTNIVFSSSTGVPLIEQTNSAASSLAVDSQTVQSVHIKLTGAGNQTVTGISDSLTSELGDVTNYREDVLEINAAHTSASFSSNGTQLLMTLLGGGVKTLSEIEAVKFTDTTVRIVGAQVGGYASVAEATHATEDGSYVSHANLNDYIYLVASGDIYQYHG